MVLKGANLWVAEQFVRLRGASFQQLRAVAERSASAPSEATIRAALRHLTGASGSPALVQKFPRPCGEEGYVLSDVGLEVVAGQREWADAAFVDQSFPPTTVHEQWICDLAVTWGRSADVLTEFEVQRTGGEGRRPDLWVRDGEHCWAIEVETSIKGSTGNASRYRDLAAAQGKGAMKGPFGPPDAVLYLANTAIEHHRNHIAEAVVAGAFDPVQADVEHDIVIVVDPIGLDAIGARPFYRRRKRIEQLVRESREVLFAAVGVAPPTALTMGYVTPTTRELPPERGGVSVCCGDRGAHRAKRRPRCARMPWRSMASAQSARGHDDPR
jgi:hypothetical protein